jgi:hypothetical protein
MFDEAMDKRINVLSIIFTAHFNRISVIYGWITMTGSVAWLGVF